MTVETAVGCPSCGLFAGHVEGCRGVIAAYWQYGRRYEDDGHQSVEDALRFLCNGEGAGSLSSDSIVLGDGTILMTGDEIGAVYVNGGVS